MKNTLNEKDLGKWLTYISGTGDEERGKLLAFNNDRKIAWIVYNCNNNWDADHWKDYTACATEYRDIKELQKAS